MLLLYHRFPPLLSGTLKRQQRKQQQQSRHRGCDKNISPKRCSGARKAIQDLRKQSPRLIRTQLNRLHCLPDENFFFFPCDCDFQLRLKAIVSHLYRLCFNYFPQYNEIFEGPSTRLPV